MGFQIGEEALQGALLGGAIELTVLQRVGEGGLGGWGIGEGALVGLGGGFCQRAPLCRIATLAQRER